jgi:hypothetical protein
MSNDAEQITTAVETEEETKECSSVMRLVGWVSAGVAVAVLGVIVGRELRNRYRFNRRTPYDFYANAGEYDMGEFGVGI